MRAIRPGREVVYQIFPDRWKNAQPEINPVDNQWQWKGKAIRHSSDVSELTAPIADQHTFFGGDLEGIRQSLDYLDDLGVTALYLTPIFGARTTHRYDTVDYHSICPLLGTRVDFENLVADMRKKKMALILDGVLNHTSDDHPWHLDAEMRKNRYIMKDDSSAMGWEVRISRNLILKIRMWSENSSAFLMRGPKSISGGSTRRTFCLRNF